MLFSPISFQASKVPLICLFEAHGLRCHLFSILWSISFVFSFVNWGTLITVHVNLTWNEYELIIFSYPLHPKTLKTIHRMLNENIQKPYFHLSLKWHTGFLLIWYSVLSTFYYFSIFCTFSPGNYLHCQAQPKP